MEREHDADRNRRPAAREPRGGVGEKHHGSRADQRLNREDLRSATGAQRAPAGEHVRIERCQVEGCRGPEPMMQDELRPAPVDPGVRIEAARERRVSEPGQVGQTPGGRETQEQESREAPGGWAGEPAHDGRRMHNRRDAGVTVACGGASTVRAPRHGVLTVAVASEPAPCAQNGRPNPEGARKVGGLEVWTFERRRTGHFSGSERRGRLRG